MDFITWDREWDVGKLMEEFGPYWTHIISQVQINEVGADRFFWSLGPSKMYSVKFGYLAEIGYFLPPSSSSLSDKEWNKAVWNVNVPAKVRIFMWRLLNDLIATPLNLLNHHVPIFGRCDGCRKDWGSSIHVLYLCDDTKHIWKGSIFWEFMKRSRFKSMGELGYELRKNCSKTEYELWVLTSYFAWQFVCKKKHDSNAHVYKVSLDSSRSYLNEFQTARKSLHTSCGLGVQVGERVWKPPPSGIFCLDVDAAVNEENQRFGYGAVIRDCNGRICAAMAMPATSPGSIVEAEVQAMIHGLELCCHEKCVPIDVYSDSLLAVKLLTSEKNEIEFMGSKTNLLVRAFEDGVIKHFYHMFRSANILAHSLAQFGARCDKMYTWNSSFPPWLRRLVE